MSRAYSKTGINTLRKNVRNGLDERTRIAKQLKAWKADLARDLGGERTLTAAQRMLVDAAVHANLFLQRLDTLLIASPRLVQGTRNSIVPALKERNSIHADLAKHLAQLQESSKAAKGRRGSMLDDLRRQMAAETP